MATPVESRSSILGLKTVPNNEAFDVENYCEVDFPYKPKKAFLRGRNVPILVVHSLVNQRISKSLLRLINATRPLSVGTYLSPYFTIVLKSGDGDVETAYHENGHAVIENKFPGMNDFFYQTEIDLLNNRELDTDLLNKLIAFVCIDEGISEWIEYMTASRKGSDSGELFKFKFSDRSKLIDEAESHIYFAETQIGLLNRKLRGLKRVGAINLILNHNLYFPYIWGFHFVSKIIQGLEELGVDIDDSLNLLLQNPPVNLHQLKDPSQYAKTL